MCRDFGHMNTQVYIGFIKWVHHGLYSYIPFLLSTYSMITFILNTVKDNYMLHCGMLLEGENTSADKKTFSAFSCVNYQQLQNHKF